MSDFFIPSDGHLGPDVLITSLTLLWLTGKPRGSKLSTVAVWELYHRTELIMRTQTLQWCQSRCIVFCGNLWKHRFLCLWCTHQLFRSASSRVKNCTEVKQWSWLRLSHAIYHVHKRTSCEPEFMEGRLQMTQQPLGERREASALAEEQQRSSLPGSSGLWTVSQWTQRAPAVKRRDLESSGI